MRIFSYSCDVLPIAVCKHNFNITCNNVKGGQPEAVYQNVTPVTKEPSIRLK